MKTGFSGSVTSHWRRVKRRPSFSQRAPRRSLLAVGIVSVQCGEPNYGVLFLARGAIASKEDNEVSLRVLCLIEPARLVFTLVLRLGRLETAMDAALSKLAKKDVPYAKMIPVQKDSDKSEFVEAHDERWVTSQKRPHRILVGSCPEWCAATPFFCWRT